MFMLKLEHEKQLLREYGYDQRDLDLPCYSKYYLSHS
jgi:hypothetical protein